MDRTQLKPKAVSKLKCVICYIIQKTTKKKANLYETL